MKNFLLIKCNNVNDFKVGIMRLSKKIKKMSERYKWEEDNIVEVANGNLIMYKILYDCGSLIESDYFLVRPSADKKALQIISDFEVKKFDDYVQEKIVKNIMDLFGNSGYDFIFDDFEFQDAVVERICICYDFRIIGSYLNADGNCVAVGSYGLKYFNKKIYSYAKELYPKIKFIKE